MGTRGARFLNYFRAAKTWAARRCGDWRLGHKPNSPLVSAPGPPPAPRRAWQQPAKNSAVDLVHQCFVCGLQLSHEIDAEEHS